MTYRDLKSRNAVYAAMREYDALGQTGFLDKYGFKPSRQYTVQNDGKEYDSKPLLAAAYGIRFPERGALGNTFGGGKEAAGRSLVRLGFDVAGLPPKQGDWSLREVEFVLSEYVALLDRHLQKESFVKSREAERVANGLPDRNKSAVQRKFGNISSILQSYQQPWIDGFTPQHNVQTLLEAVIYDKIEEDDLLSKSVTTAAPSPDRIAYDPEVDPPGGLALPDPATGFGGKKIDFRKREKRQRELGREGEKWALAHLKKVYGKSHEIIWSSEKVGDGLGYDIEIRPPGGKSIFFEVKTTTGDGQKPFHITANEIAASERYGKQYRLMRIFGFPGQPKFYILKGSIKKHCSLRGTTFLALPS